MTDGMMVSLIRSRRSLYSEVSPFLILGIMRGNITIRNALFLVGYALNEPVYPFLLAIVYFIITCIN